MCLWEVFMLDFNINTRLDDLADISSINLRAFFIEDQMNVADRAT